MNENLKGNVMEISESQQIDKQLKPMLEKQVELESTYKGICAQEVLLIEQLKQVQDQRKACAGQLELVRSICSVPA